MKERDRLLKLKEEEYRKLELPFDGELYIWDYRYVFMILCLPYSPSSTRPSTPRLLPLVCPLVYPFYLPLSFLSSSISPRLCVFPSLTLFPLLSYPRTYQLLFVYPRRPPRRLFPAAPATPDTTTANTPNSPSTSTTALSKNTFPLHASSRPSSRYTRTYSAWNLRQLRGRCGILVSGVYFPPTHQQTYLGGM